MDKKTFDLQLKNDSAANKFRVEGNYIVFDKTTNLNYKVLPNFTLKELLTKNPVASYTKLNKDLLLKLHTIRQMLGKPIGINSSYRSPEYNKTVPGAASNSRHTIGDALDLAFSANPYDLANVIDSLNYQNTERGIYSWGVHFALGSGGKWDKMKDDSLLRKAKDFFVNDNYRNLSVFGIMAVLALLFFRKMVR